MRKPILAWTLFAFRTIITQINKIRTRYNFYITSHVHIKRFHFSCRNVNTHTHTQSALHSHTSSKSYNRDPKPTCILLHNPFIDVLFKKPTKLVFNSPLVCFLPSFTQPSYCRTRAPPSRPSCGAWSPSSGPSRSYTTTLMTYQHFTHTHFPTTIKVFWTMHVPKLPEKGGGDHESQGAGSSVVNGTRSGRQPPPQELLLSVFHLI